MAWSNKSTVLASSGDRVRDAAFVTGVWFVVGAECIACLLVNLTIQTREFRSASHITDEASVKMNISNRVETDSDGSRPNEG